MTIAERLIREFGVAVIPGTTFGMDRGCYLRVAYGALAADTIGEGIGRLRSRSEVDRARMTFMQIVACQLDIAWEDKAASHRACRAHAGRRPRSNRGR